MKNKKNRLYLYCIIFLILLSLTTIIIKKYNKFYDNLTRSELKKHTKTISNKTINSNYNGELVLLKGKLQYKNEILTDNLFNIEIKTPRLFRYVEIYQWVEHKEINKKGKKVYKYEKVWSDKIIKSKKFKKKSHINPTKKIIKSKSFTHDTIKIGEFELSKKQKKNIGCNIRLKLSSNFEIPHKNYIIYDNYFTNSKNPEKPKIGDYRISYYYSDWKNVTVLAVQSNNTFTDFISKKKEKINYIIGDKFTKEEMIDIFQPQK